MMFDLKFFLVYSFEKSSHILQMETFFKFIIAYKNRYANKYVFKGHNNLNL